MLECSSYFKKLETQLMLAFYKANLGLAFLLSFFSLIGILVIRTTLGVDISDEMQYYGQIYSFIETNELFQNDLFFKMNNFLLIK